jgi:Lipocalin-like domain
MDRRTAVAFATVLVGSGLVLGSSALAQQKSVKDQLVGSWIFVSSTTKAEDGSPFWGANPKGLVIFTANGRYSTHLMRSDRPKFSANSRTKGTPEENKAAVLGNISSFGTYTVDEDKKTFTIRFEGSTYPNLEGTVQARPSETNCGSQIRPDRRRAAFPYRVPARQVENRTARIVGPPAAGSAGAEGEK